MSFIPMAKKLNISLILLLVSTVFSSMAYSEENDSAKYNEFTALLEQHKGKVIYIDFWASWCVPCRKSFPWMNKIQNNYSPEKFTVISINLDSDKTLANEFLQTLPASFPVIYDPKGELAKKFHVKGMPSSYLADQQGKIVSHQTGFFTEESSMYEAEIMQLLNSADLIENIAMIRSNKTSGSKGNDLTSSVLTKKH
ncbi:TlpA family protein disulfide reductase [Pseudocolwellia sp. HL-MZ19]|uniref:TlpA family protein disulfide reductase n=1 Tax=unclassified Pseudocolwellia TaxID=2848178 RepID=UPI003CEEAC9C